MPTQSIQLTSGRKDALNRLLAVPKFHPDKAASYLGAASEGLRIACEEHVNGVVKRLLDVPGESLSVDVVMRTFKSALRGMDAFGSTERDRICHYLEQIMDILGIENAGGLLNNWRYGIDPA